MFDSFNAYLRGRWEVLRDTYESLSDIATLSYNPVLLALEKMGFVPPDLVATVDHVVQWPYDDDKPELGVYDETITFMLLQYPSGRRDWLHHSYGRSDNLEYFDTFLRDVLVWTYGGPLPKNHLKPGEQAKVINFRVLKGAE